MLYNTRYCFTMQCYTIQYGKMQCNTIQYKATSKISDYEADTLNLQQQVLNPCGMHRLDLHTTPAKFLLFVHEFNLHY